MSTTWNAQLDTDFTESVAITDSAGAVFDLTAHTLTTEVRDKLNGTLLVGPKTIIPTLASSGQADVVFTKAEVNTMGLGNHKCDLKIVRDSDSYVYRTTNVDIVVTGRVTE